MHVHHKCHPGLPHRSLNSVSLSDRRSQLVLARLLARLRLQLLVGTQPIQCSHSDETRAQLAAHQLAESTARTAAVQAAADLQIQQLRDELVVSPVQQLRGLVPAPQGHGAIQVPDSEAGAPVAATLPLAGQPLHARAAGSGMASGPGQGAPPRFPLGRQLGPGPDWEPAVGLLVGTGPGVASAACRLCAALGRGFARTERSPS
jgi:hypothetical protein